VQDLIKSQRDLTPGDRHQTFGDCLGASGPCPNPVPRAPDLFLLKGDQLKDRKRDHMIRADLTPDSYVDVRPVNAMGKKTGRVSRSMTPALSHCRWLRSLRGRIPDQDRRVLTGGGEPLAVG
jgi:hypothetical protein